MSQPEIQRSQSARNADDESSLLLND